MKVFFVLLSTVLLISCSHEKSQKSKKDPYQETWESVSTYPKNPDFFLDAKFGIYTHCGPVTIGSDYPDSRGGVQWYGQHMYNKDNEAYYYHRERFGDQNEIGISTNNISAVSLLGSDEAISLAESGGVVRLKLPKPKPCDYAFCFKFELN